MVRATPGRPRSRPIIAQIVLLVAAAVTLATAALFAVTFQGPPPRSAPVPVAEVAAILNGTEDRLPPRATLSVSAVPPVAPAGFSPDPTARSILAEATKRDIRVFTAKPMSQRGGGRPGTDADEFRGGILAAVNRGTGWRVLSIPADPWLSSWHVATLAAMLGTMAVLTTLAWLVARRIAQPLARLAEAADATRARPADPPIPVDGPPEVRRVAEALTRMRDRLSATMATRTEMLTGIAHDMGTPLARIAFHIDGLPDAARTAALDEIAGIRAMIGSVLDFARDTPPRTDPVDIATLLRQIVETTSGRATLAAPDVAILWGDATVLKRLFSNLVDNALRYAGSCAVTLDASPDAVTVRIVDHGPGLGDDIALMFEPFVRGERSRSRDTGGVGLGLAIARRAAEAHGGTITAMNRAEGGAAFRIVLPITR